MSPQTKKKKNASTVSFPHMATSHRIVTKEMKGVPVSSVHKELPTKTTGQRHSAKWPPGPGGRRGEPVPHATGNTFPRTCRLQPSRPQSCGRLTEEDFRGVCGQIGELLTTERRVYAAGARNRESHE